MIQINHCGVINQAAMMEIQKWIYTTPLDRYSAGSLKPTTLVWETIILLLGPHKYFGSRISLHTSIELDV